MDVEKAIEILTQGLNIASKQGAYTLQDSASLFSALDLVTKYVKNIETSKSQAKEEVVKKEKK